MRGSSPEPLVRDVLLRDGSTLRLQAPTPVDFEDIKAFYDGLSPESRYLRFHGFTRTDIVARADVEATGVDRLALIGRHDGLVAAVAGYDRLREPGAAEVAFAVADEDQRRGIGTRMLEQLAAIAADRGIRRFDAAVLASNHLMLGVFDCRLRGAAPGLGWRAHGVAGYRPDAGSAGADRRARPCRVGRVVATDPRALVGSGGGRGGRAGQYRPCGAGEHHRRRFSGCGDTGQPRGGCGVLDAGGWLSLADAEALLATHGIPVAASYRCLDLERAIAMAAEIGGPVALKADSAAPTTASDIDTVLLGLQGESAIRSGWLELERRVQAAGRKWNGAIIQPLGASGRVDLP